MNTVLSNIFLKKLAQQVGLLLIEEHKVSQRCLLGCGQPKGDRLMGVTQLVLNSYAVFNLDVSEDQIADRLDHGIRGYQPTA